ncbi:uncharacterized protein J7T54_001161 [Emericellopsis cladophorae]|uniref:Zn(2)-C6 fungal-type domain-containing protein n=1 Tax=Emericellopsis cladophorae TaxID=2686198 RepID=A0A9P9XZC9_9HYPO|nr:uncharacterized protein J7T54_001161 [Emericellopsis cladophorae]KAI6780657.1 hypothetical protein J7T54_001161 [Emericellopsis cladophorae]
MAVLNGSKRRHVKCDEARPSCRLCVLSDRVCTYTSQDSALRVNPPSETPSTDGSCSPAPHSEPNERPVPGTVRPNLEGLAGNPSNGHTESDEVNFDHMELLIHLTVDEDVFSLADHVEDYKLAMSIGLPLAHATPYLLYQMLAFSARHLAHLHPHRFAKYHNLAVGLQTRAVSLFNASGTAPTPDNCVPMLLFATILGHHLFADMLSQREDGGFHAFITRFTHCLELQKGIPTIFTTARHVLMTSPLEPVLKGSMDLTARDPTGDDCDELMKLISSSSQLTPSQKESCLASTRFLQVGFDSSADGDESPQRHQMCFTWTLVVSPEVTALMATCQPEALAMLFYYALLLHSSSSVWQIGASGEYIMDKVATFLGPSWEYWLSAARRKTAQSSHDAAPPSVV